MLSRLGHYIANLLPWILLLTAIYLRFTNEPALIQWAGEDKFVEIAQVYLWFSAFIIFCVSLYKSRNTSNLIFYTLLLLMLVSIFFTMEEISWGQRIFQTETLQVFKESNLQGENTIHNSGVFGYIVNQVFLAIGLIGVTLILFKKKLLKYSMVSKFKLFLPSKSIFSALAVLFLIYFLYLVARPLDLSWYTSSMTEKELEVGELSLAIGVFVYSLEIWKKIKNI